jgi:hypothetical protein
MEVVCLKMAEEKYSIVMIEELTCDIFPLQLLYHSWVQYNCSVHSSPYQSQEFNFFNLPCSEKGRSSCCMHFIKKNGIFARASSYSFVQPVRSQLTPANIRTHSMTSISHTLRLILNIFE